MAVVKHLNTFLHFIFDAIRVLRVLFCQSSSVYTCVNVCMWALRLGSKVAGLFKVLKLCCALLTNWTWLCHPHQHSDNK